MNCFKFENCPRFSSFPLFSITGGKNLNCGRFANFLSKKIESAVLIEATCNDDTIGGIVNEAVLGLIEKIEKIERKIESNAYTQFMEKMPSDIM